MEWQLITKTRLYKYIENFISKNWKFSEKKTLIFFPISAQNIDCGYSLEPPPRGGSNEYPQSMFLSTNKKNNVYPCKPQFYHIKVGFKGVKIIQVCSCDGCDNCFKSCFSLWTDLVKQNLLFLWDFACIRSLLSVTCRYNRALKRFFFVCVCLKLTLILELYIKLQLHFFLD